MSLYGQFFWLKDHIGFLHLPEKDHGLEGVKQVEFSNTTISTLKVTPVKHDDNDDHTLVYRKYWIISFFHDGKFSKMIEMIGGIKWAIYIYIIYIVYIMNDVYLTNFETVCHTYYIWDMFFEAVTHPWLFHSDMSFQKIYINVQCNPVQMTTFYKNFQNTTRDVILV